MRLLVLLLAVLLALQASAQVDSPAAARAVVVKPLAEIAIHPEREASAQVVSLNESRIAAEVAGRIEVIAVRVGERVARGAVLARINCRDHELAFERASANRNATRARLSLAEKQLARARELGTQGFFSDEAVAARETEVQVLRAEGEQVRTQLSTAALAVERCTVRAPFAAIVRERLGQVGELAVPGSPLIALSDAGRIEVSAQVQPKDTESLSKAAELRFVSDGAVRALALLRISPALNFQARSVEARLRFSGKPAAAGTSGLVVWRDSRAHVPAEFVVRRAGQLGVFVDERGTAQFHALSEAQEGRPAPSDLAPNARIVVAGQLALRDGDPMVAPGK
jgi:RND family efflux transporter MFP subunit